MKVELLPKGEFIINENAEKKIPGRFSMYAWNVFMTKHNLDNYLKVIDLMAKGMSLAHYADLLACGLNDYDRTNPKYNQESAMDFIDNLFDKGHNDEAFINLVFHAVGRIGVVPEIPDQLKGEDDRSEEEKKS